MNIRKLALGNHNLIGRRVTLARQERNLLQKDLLAKLQVQGISISSPALSLLEAQKRPVSDFELVALAAALKKDVHWLLYGDDGV